MTVQKYLYLMAIPDRLTELASAESVALTGVPPNVHGITVSETCVDVRRGAYVKSCTEVLFEATSVAELYAKVRAADLYADGFRVSIVKKPRSLKVDSITCARQLGSFIGGQPDLSHPRLVFLAVFTPEAIWFGVRLSESDGTWVSHNQRPYMTSSSLPARLARVLVNLVASPGERLLDPCCGTGMIVMAAAHSGLQAVGYDINPRMVGATTKNLRHYGLTADVQLADARKIQGRFDAIATDLPYGMSLVKDTAQEHEILANLRTCAPKIALIHTRDMSHLLNRLGYRVEAVIPVPKQRFVRRIFIALNPPQ